jgi:GNAT superfamily N-acetyltransferase
VIGVRIRLLDADALEPGILDGLAEVLADCVAGGASVGWVAVPEREAACDWWRGFTGDPAVSTWVAVDDAERVLGTISLVRAHCPNGSHRAEVVKLLVHRGARGRGVAPALMAALEAQAAGEGRTLLVLDTETGSLAESLYARWGWSHVGTIPEYALSPAGVLAGTTLMTKTLTSTAAI